MIKPPPLLQHNDALFLDFDGTLVEIAARPDLVRVPQRLPQILGALQALLHGALAIVTGRRFADVRVHLQPLVAPGAGQHGAEFFLPGKPSDAAASSPRVHQAVVSLKSRFADVPGVIIEDKGLSVSLHYRNAPGRELECEKAMQILATQLGLSMLHGKKVIEARASPMTKGDGISVLMDLPEFRGRRPIFLGDDITDEYGFTAVNRVGGTSIKVGAGSTAAQFGLANVAAVQGWLERSLKSLSA